MTSGLNPNARTFDFASPHPSSPVLNFSRNFDINSSEGRLTNIRHMSKKDAAAATRRRRHSVDALDFTGLKLVDVPTFLRHIRLHKYTGIMRMQNVTFTQLLQMSEEELERRGVRAQGARTRLVKAIERYNQYLAYNWSAQGMGMLESIIPMGALDSTPRYNNISNNGPSMSLFSWPESMLGDMRDEAKPYHSPLYPIDEYDFSPSSSSDQDQDDGDLSDMVALAGEQLLSIIDEDDCGERSRAESSWCSPQYQMQSNVYNDNSSFGQPRRVSYSGPSNFSQINAFEMWGSAAPSSSAWGYGSVRV